MKLNADFFAREEYRDYTIYKALAATESIPEFKKILLEFVEHEKGDYEFWSSLSKQKQFHVGALDIFFHKLIRTLFGLTFTIKLLEGREKGASKRYKEYITSISDKTLREKIESIVTHEQYHERKLLEQIGEGRLKFVSSIVLGLNDGLIELTGALVGFSFALGENALVALAGTITGVSASLSMAASAYMQARYEKGKDPVVSGLITGLSYSIVVAVLVAPFFIFETTLAALFSMAGAVFVILVGVSSYSSVLLEKPFPRQFGEMFIFSVGIAIIAFFIGLAFRSLTGVSL